MACLMFSYRVASKSPNKSLILISGKKYDGTVLKLLTLKPGTGYSWDIATVAFETFPFEGNVRVCVLLIHDHGHLRFIREMLLVDVDYVTCLVINRFR